MIVSIFSTITFFGINRTNVLEHQKSIKDIYKIIPFLKALPCYDWLVGITVNIIFIWSVCIILDILAIKMPLIGFDIMMGIKEKQIHNTLASMIFKIITYKPIAWVENKYNSLGLEENCNQEPEQTKIYVIQENIETEKEEPEQIEQTETKLIESKKDPEETEEKLFEKKLLNLENIEKVFEYIINNLKPGNVSQGIKKIADNTNMSTSEVIRIREQLVKFGYLQSDKEKMQTLVIKEKLNLKDFEEDNDNE
jgi:hypothetical protein